MGFPTKKKSPNGAVRFSIAKAHGRYGHGCHDSRTTWWGWWWDMQMIREPLCQVKISDAQLLLYGFWDGYIYYHTSTIVLKLNTSLVSCSVLEFRDEHVKQEKMVTILHRSICPELLTSYHPGVLEPRRGRRLVGSLWDVITAIYVTPKKLVKQAHVFFMFFSCVFFCSRDIHPQELEDVRRNFGGGPILIF